MPSAMCFTVIVLTWWSCTGAARRVHLAEARRAGSHRSPSQQLLPCDQLHLSREVDAYNASHSFATLLLGFNAPTAGKVAGLGCKHTQSSHTDPARRCSDLRMNPPFASDDAALSQQTSTKGSLAVPLDPIFQEAHLARPVVRTIYDPEVPFFPVRTQSGVSTVFRKIVKVCAVRSTSKAALQCCLISGTADVAVQLMSTSAQEFNYVRTISFMLFGQLYCGAFQPTVYRRFDRWFRGLKRKLLAEFLVYMPLVYIPSFYMITGMLQGLGWAGSFAKLCALWSTAIQSEYKIWLIPMIVYFRWVPERYRVLYLSVLGLIERITFSFLEQMR